MQVWEVVPGYFVHPDLKLLLHRYDFNAGSWKGSSTTYAVCIRGIGSRVNCMVSWVERLCAGSADNFGC